MDYAGLGYLGAIIGLANGAYYIWTILKGHTKPHRISWFGWALIGILGAWSAFAGGAGAGALVAAVGAGIIVFVFLLSLLPGYGKPGGRRMDYVISAAAVVTIILWRTLHFSPGIAAVIAVVADSWFTWLTIRETWRQPETEALSPWIISAFSDSLGVAALQTFAFSAALFPVYLMITTTLISCVILVRREARGKQPHDQEPVIF